MAKRIVIPICWAVYKVPDETMATLGTWAATAPPSVVMELLQFQGKLKRELVVHNWHEVHNNEDHDDTIRDDEHTHGPSLWGTEEEEDEDEE